MSAHPSPAPPHLLGIFRSACFPQTAGQTRGRSRFCLPSDTGARARTRTHLPALVCLLFGPSRHPGLPPTHSWLHGLIKTFVHRDRSCETLRFGEHLTRASSRCGKLLTKDHSAARRGALDTQGQGTSWLCLLPQPAARLCVSYSTVPSCQLQPWLGMSHSLCSLLWFLLFGGSPVTLCHHGRKQ